MMAEEAKTAWVIGGSGLVGGELLHALLDGPTYARVIALSRRPLSLDHPRLANRILRFEAMESELRGMRCDDAYCCLGTTRRQSGTAGYQAVDHDLVLRFARSAQQAGAQQFILISSVDANPGSRHAYLRTKGAVENALTAMQFRSLHIMQPGVISGRRREFRAAEELATIALTLAGPLLLGKAQRWRVMPARLLAAAMHAAAMTARPGVHRYTWESMQKLTQRRTTARV